MAVAASLTVVVCYTLPSAADSFTEGARSISVEVDMPPQSDFDENETLHCEAVTSIGTSGMSGEAVDLALRAEQGSDPLVKLRRRFGSIMSEEFQDELCAFLFYMLSGPSGLLMITGFLDLIARISVWAVRKRQ